MDYLNTTSPYMSDQHTNRGTESKLDTKVEKDSIEILRGRSLNH